MKEKIGVDKRARRKLIIASTLCVLFMIGEIIGKVFFLKSKRNIDSTEKLRKSFVTGDIRQFIVLYTCILTYKMSDKTKRKLTNSKHVEVLFIFLLLKNQSHVYLVCISVGVGIDIHTLIYIGTYTQIIHLPTQVLVYCIALTCTYNVQMEMLILTSNLQIKLAICFASKSNVCMNNCFLFIHTVYEMKCLQVGYQQEVWPLYQMLLIC